MHVFVTGASGWIGSHTVDDLLTAGHVVTGLARSDASAAALAAKGVEVLRGDLDDLDVIHRGAAESEGVLHLANKHDFANPAVSDAAERASIETIGAALAGSDRPFVFAAGVAGLASGRPATEADPNPFVGPDAPRGGGENRGFDFVEQRVRAVAARFSPTTHGPGDHGFVAYIVATARQHGVSAYIGEGTNRWAAVHVADAARLVRLGLEQAPAGTRMHAVAETGIPTRAIAEAIGEGLGLPVASIDPADAPAHFGFMASFFGMDMSATSEATRELLDWRPTGPGLLQDIAAGAYFDVRVA
ncbi:MULTISPECIES: SDR family oxidoreductase [unclassified Curtobacterium]|uniref:SDR family oxidoreductase n=1 Tax=unclassified Curtobacterium TaxID=257496 RepID=UPI000D8E353E|nr:MULTISPECIES: SDR family oxidoreductase [unclassified Curtobacterium]PYY64019.1 3-beta hydroxysteroid dehydrogenase [Curtobacterium sp. MCPF17_003]PZE67261.1 3-beta hydroxysteroid dehydrogenase [Curtobacterium sp. MCPF17_018]WIB70207.1 SDR family oxidoreductase [Curtobacterium sp. MCBD17_026]